MEELLVSHADLKVLLLTPVFPPAKDSQSGVYKRLDMLVTALSTLTTHMHVVSYVVHDLDVSEFAVSKYRKKLGERWNTSLTLSVIPRKLFGKAKSFSEEYFVGIHDVAQQEQYRQICSENKLASVITSLPWRPDVIFAHRLDTYISSRLVDSLQDIPVILDLDDVEHKALTRRLLKHPGWKMERLKLLKVPALLWAEREACRNAQAIFVCSDRDAKYLNAIAQSNRVKCVPNAVEMPIEIPPMPKNQRVLFLGTYIYQPNAIAADYLINDIWPLIAETCPNAELVIAGKQPEILTSYDSSPDRVSFTGFVEDLVALYASTQLVVCPITTGGGTRIKIIEAASFGRPIVATTIGAEGLDFAECDGVIQKDTPADFAQQCIALLNDPERCEALGKNARARAKQLFDAKEAQKNLRALMQEVLAG